MSRDPYRVAERILLVLFGGLSGAGLFWVTSWKLEPKITLGELFGGIITVFLAFVVSVLIERAKASNTALNGLLLQRVEELRQLFRETHSLSHQQVGSVWSKELGNKIVANLRSASMLMTDLEELTGQVYQTDFIMRMKQHYFKYKQLVTNAGPKNPLTSDRMSDAEAVYRDIRQELTNIIVRVCRR